jgi:hypothetical protein
MRTLLYQSKPVVATAEGGALAGGMAVVSVPAIPTGGSLASGASVPIAGFQGVGGATAGGSATIALRLTTAGGSLAGGMVSPTGSAALSSGGGLLAGGMAVVSVSPTASGGSLASGSAAIACGAEGVGGLAAGGEGIADHPPGPIVELVQGSLVVNGLLTWFGTGMPMEPTLPYADLGEFEEEADYQSEDDDGSAPYEDRAEIPVSIYASSASECKTLGRQLASTLTDAALTFSDGELLYLRRAKKGSAPTLDPDPAPGGGDCWSLLVTFKAITSKTT